MLFLVYRLQLWQCIEAGCLTVPLCSPVTGFTFVSRKHGSPYTPAHVLIENTLVELKMAKNSRMALCCQNQVSKGTNQCYGLYDSACIAVHSALVTVLGLLKKKKEKKKKKKEVISRKWRFCCFQVSYLKHFYSSYKWLR